MNSEPLTRPAIDVSDKYVVVNGLRLHYVEANSGCQQTIVLIHGLNMPCEMWLPLLPSLPRNYRIIALDPRGHGKSEWAQDGYPVTAFASDLDQFVKEVNACDLTLIGHSLGARIALAYAGSRPQGLARLVISDTGPEVALEAARHLKARQGALLGKRGFRDRSEALSYIAAMQPSWHADFHRLYVDFQLRTNWVGKLVHRSDPETFWITGSAGVREIPLLWKAVSRIEVPTVILRGSDSAFFSSEVAERMRDDLASATLVELNAGHYLPMEASVRFCDVVASTF